MTDMALNSSRDSAARKPPLGPWPLGMWPLWTWPAGRPPVSIAAGAAEWLEMRLLRLCPLAGRAAEGLACMGSPRSLDCCQETPGFLGVCSAAAGSSGLPWVLPCLWLAALLPACGVAQEPQVPSCRARGDVPCSGHRFFPCCFAAAVWGRAACPAPGRVRLTLDVGEEVEQHRPGGSDSAFSLLLQIIVTLLIYLSAASNSIFFFSCNREF